MFKVTFLKEYDSVPKGFSFEFDGLNSIRLNGLTLDMEGVNTLKSVGLVTVVSTDVCGAGGGCGECNALPDATTNVVTVNLDGESIDKMMAALNDDMENQKFVYGSEYKFYDIELCEWKVSRFKKTASHLGRLVGGFAVPVDASAKKMFNRLEKLNNVYTLGLDRDTIREITNYYN